MGREQDKRPIGIDGQTGRAIKGGTRQQERRDK